ncbi:MAG: pyridoxal-phosphate dependent enzyme [Desulfobacteraceae bacterium]|nr:pyridoxal-phosphate dependent enzyme [Desulfobacteraceae bacterium]
MEQVKVLLDDNEIPREWYNILSDLPTPMSPPLHPGTGKPIGPQDLAPVFPMNLIEQEVSTERWIKIPDEVLEKYLLWRPTTLYRARGFEKLLDAPVRIYYKNEGMSPPGSHKPNTAIAQAYYNKAFGIERLSTETGAGQWGSALSMACGMFGLQCRVFMVRVSFEQKPYRRMMMSTWGAECISSPSTRTRASVPSDTHVLAALDSDRAVPERKADLRAVGAALFRAPRRQDGDAHGMYRGGREGKALNGDAQRFFDTKLRSR